MTGRLGNLLKPRLAYPLIGIGLFVVSIIGIGGSIPVAQATAGIASTINYQGRLLTSAGAVVPDGTYNMEFKIYQEGNGQLTGDTGGSGGTLLWTEQWINDTAGSFSNTAGVVVMNGYFSVNLGTYCSFSGSTCQGITNTGTTFNDKTMWISMNVAGGASATSASCTPFSSCTPDGELLPMDSVGSSPYAENSQELGGLNSGQYVQLAQGIQTASVSSQPAIGINATSGSDDLIQLQNSGADAFDVTSTGNVLLGNNSAKTISVATAPASTTGTALQITAGGGGSGTGSAGGALTLQGGAAGGTTASGGNLVLDAGAAAGASANGSILIGGTVDAPITVGKSTGVSTLTFGQSTIGQSIFIGHATVATGDTQNINVGDAATGTGKDVIVIGNTNGASSLSLNAGSAGAALNATGGSLALSTTTSGTLSVTSAGSLTLSGTNVSLNSSGILNVIGASAGFQISTAATTGNYLRGNGTSFVSSAIQYADIPTCTSSTCNYIENSANNSFTAQQAAISLSSTNASQPVAHFVQGSSATAPILLVQGGATPGAGGNIANYLDSTGSIIDSVDAYGDEEQLGFNDVAGIGGIGPYSNLLLYSEQLNQAGSWTTGGTLTVNGNNTTAPDGNTTASQLVGTGSTTLIQSHTTTTAGTYTFSVWLKQSSGSGTTGLCIFTTAGTPSSCTVTTVTPNATDWQRFSVTQVVTGSPTAVKVEIAPGNGATATIWAWGAQLVLGSTPDTYVRTTTNTVAATSGVVSNDQLTSSGGALFQDSTNSTTAFQVQNAAGYSVFSTDTSNGQIIVGTGSHVNGQIAINDSANTNVLTLTAGTTSGNDVITLPNSGATGQQCLQSTSGSSAAATTLQFSSCSGAGTLQGAYVTSAGANPSITEATADGAVSINDPASGGVTGTMFDLSSGSTNTFTESSTGAATFESQSNTPSAFQIQNATGGSLFNVSSSTDLITVGQSATNVNLYSYGAVVQNGYNSPDPMGSGTVDWTELGECDITTQYSGCASTFTMVGNSNGNGTSSQQATVFAEVYTQNTMGTNPPEMYLTINGVSEYITDTDFEFFVTQNTSSATTVKLYFHNRGIYGFYHYAPQVVDNNPGWTWTPNTALTSTTPSSCTGPSGVGSCPAPTTQLGTFGDLNADNITSYGTLTVQTTSSQPLLTAGSLQVVVGEGSTGESSGTAAVPLVLDSSNTAPTESDGAMYYSTTSRAFECGVNSAWMACGAGLASDTTTVSGAIPGTVISNGSTSVFNNQAGNYTPPINDCATGVEYRITANGTFNIATSGTNQKFLVALGLLDGGTWTAIVGPSDAASWTTNDGATRPWLMTGIITCNGGSGDTGILYQVFSSFGSSVDGDMQTIWSGPASVYTYTWPNDGTAQFQLRAWFSASAGASSSITLQQFTVERLAR